jgi:short-subunit dehydrogenase
MGKRWIQDKTIVISGASGGIGFSVAKMLIDKYNCKVIGIARNEQKILNAIQTLGDKKDNFSYRIFDVAQKENWLNFYNELVEKGIQVDVLINNAGFMLPFTKFENLTDTEIDEIINTNFISVINSTKIFLPLLKKSSTPAIVNVASSAGLCAVVGQSMYCATKHAVKGFTETLQQDYKKQIYFGGVYPGFIKTDILNRQNVDDKSSKLVSKMMMPLNKASNRIVKRLSKKKKRTVIGFDGCFMGFFGRLFPKFTPSVIRSVLKSSNLELFEGVFENTGK